MPGAIEVAAGANSRANSSRLSFDAQRAAIFSTTSRAVLRACAPYMSSPPSTSMRVALNGGRPRASNMRAMRASNAAPVRRAFATACSPPIVRNPLLRQPSAKVALTL